MTAYSLESLIESHKELISSIIKLRKDPNEQTIHEYIKAYEYLSDVCKGFIETAKFQVYYHQLKEILDDAGIDPEKLRNIRVYCALKKLEFAIVDFVKEIRYPYKIDINTKIINIFLNNLA
jgi:hypothetical protein